MHNAERSGELHENTLMWTENARPTLYGHWLALEISIEHSIYPADGSRASRGHGG